MGQRFIHILGMINEELTEERERETEDFIDGERTGI